MYCDSLLYPCSDFTGPVNCFSYTSYDPIVSQTLPEDTPVDVIGFVADVSEVINIKTSKGKETYKVNVLIQDLRMQRIYLSLWGSYADEIQAVWSNRETVGIIVVILQFGTLKYFRNCGYVNNSFGISKLLINSDVPEISEFKKVFFKLLLFLNAQLKSSKISGMFISIFDDYVSKTEFMNMAEVNLSEITKVVVVGTIKMIPSEIPWYYLSCKNCNRKLILKDDNDNKSPTELADRQLMVARQLQYPVLKDSTGTLSLTLFDRDASRLLKKDGDDGMVPDEFSTLLGKNFAFKIDISKYNLEHKFWVFGITKLTDNAEIIADLEKKANNYEGLICETINNNESGTPSQEIVRLQATIQISDDLTPMAQTKNAYEKREIVEEATFKRKFKNPEFKRKLVDEFDVHEVGDTSTTKTVSFGKKAILIPKIEK
ncbi:hypothetical protein QVD17_08387 [Tagetes erecta]|uniref:Replication protein A OB domain-containing protein n=1 Tax=Tagetes erecta TaxID=13708 RepID=A0AAD8P4L0_TARER|nr:hypothetical protein QVD17_08387 [Tagetes erecta]